MSQQIGKNLENGFKELAITNPDTIAKLDPSVIGSLESNTEAISTLPVEAQNTVLGAFMDSFHVVFWVAVPVVVIGFFFSLFLREKPLQDSQAHASAREDAAGESLG